MRSVALLGQKKSEMLVVNVSEIYIVLAPLNYHYCSVVDAEAIHAKHLTM